MVFQRRRQRRHIFPAYPVNVVVQEHEPSPAEEPGENQPEVALNAQVSVPAGARGGKLLVHGCREVDRERVAGWQIQRECLHICASGPVDDLLLIHRPTADDDQGYPGSPGQADTAPQLSDGPVRRHQDRVEPRVGRRRARFVEQSSM